jgi:putative transcriptional regulator
LPARGGGKSGGFRALILLRAGERAFFVHGFAKCDRDNIRDDELAGLAAELLNYDDAALAKAYRGGRPDGGDAMKKQYRSRVLASVHETAEGLTDAGVMSKQTMREFDELCLTPVRPLSQEEIRELREREGASQAVFARYLNVTTGLVSQWERGEKHPQGSSLKLLALVAKNGLSGVA